MSNCKPIDELTIEDLKQNPIWEWAIDEEEYDETEDEYIALEDVVKKLNLPVTIHIILTINEESKTLIFPANKVDIYKNTIKTNLY